MPCRIGDRIVYEGEDAGRLYSRSFFGRMSKGKLYLSAVECAYLLEKGKIAVEGCDGLEDCLDALRWHDRAFDIRYRVYRDIRDRGYYVGVSRTRFRVYEKGENPFRKGKHFHVYPISESSMFSPEAVAKRAPCVYAVVDLDGDVTYYRVSTVNPRGKYSHDHVGEIRVCGEMGMGAGTLHSPFEVLYLAKKGLATPIVDGEEVGWRELREYYGAIVPGFASRYLLYEDLSDRGLLVKSGFKYGTHFRAYISGLEEHAEYLAHYMAERAEWHAVSRAVRLAHGVRKTLLIGFGEPVEYLKVERVLL